MKQGKYTPGSHIKIYPPTMIYENKANIIFLCSWNIADEIVNQEKRFADSGGRFMVPFPEPHFIKKRFFHGSYSQQFPSFITPDAYWGFRIFTKVSLNNNQFASW